MSEIDRGTSGTGSANSGESAITRYQVSNALTSAGFQDPIVLTNAMADEALTPSRREILQILATEDVESVRQLAERLGRDKGNVSRDLGILIDNDLVKVDADGRSKRPILKHDTILVEPVVSNRQEPT